MDNYSIRSQCCGSVAGSDFFRDPGSDRTAQFEHDWKNTQYCSRILLVGNCGAEQCFASKNLKSNGQKGFLRLLFQLKEVNIPSHGRSQQSHRRR